MRKKASSLKREECPECGNRNLIHDSKSGEIICGGNDGCGLVIHENQADRGPEWRAFDLAQIKARTRTGAPTTLLMHDKGTTIQSITRDASGRKIPISTLADMWRLRNLQRRSKISAPNERSLVFAIAEINKLGDKLHVPKAVLETAALIYHKALENKLIRGRSIITITAACLYIACRKHGIVRSTKEISEFTMATKKEINRVYRDLFWKLDIVNIIIEKPSIHIKKIGDRLNLLQPIQELAWQILKIAKEKRLTNGRGPSGMAAAAVYIACVLNDEKRTQGQIAKVAGVTEVTIRNRYKDLMKSLQIIVNLIPETEQPLSAKKSPKEIFPIEEEPFVSDFTQENKDIARLSRNLAIPGLTEDLALSIVKKVVDTDLFLNKGSYELALICLYAACHIQRIPKSAKLFSSIGDVEEEEILRDYELLVGKLNL